MLTPSRLSSCASQSFIIANKQWNRKEALQATKTCAGGVLSAEAAAVASCPSQKKELAVQQAAFSDEESWL